MNGRTRSELPLPMALRASGGPPTRFKASLRRCWASLLCELELQARNGLYAATGFVVLVILATLVTLPTSGIARLLPALALNSLAITAFFFGAALSLLATAEGSAAARSVTPLRPAEALVARTLSLALLGGLQLVALGLVLLGLTPALGLLVLGAVLSAAILALFGAALAAGEQSLSQFVLRALPWLVGLLIPMITDVLDWHIPLLWFHPLEGPMSLMRAAIVPTTWPMILLGFGLALVWLGASFGFALRRWR
ncbi:MAG: hypothetical protein AB4911_25005 [Oscillochloridaceae bacterium umkhey_bin13]